MPYTLFVGFSCASQVTHYTCKRLTQLTMVDAQLMAAINLYNNRDAPLVSLDAQLTAAESADNGVASHWCMAPVAAPDTGTDEAAIPAAPGPDTTSPADMPAPNAPSGEVSSGQWTESAWTGWSDASWTGWSDASWPRDDHWPAASWPRDDGAGERHGNRHRAEGPYMRDPQERGGWQAKVADLIVATLDGDSTAAWIIANDLATGRTSMAGHVTRSRQRLARLRS